MRSAFYLICLLTLAACKKEIGKPLQQQQLHITDLQGQEIGYNEGKRFDIDGNGTNDVAFTTYHIGDPLLKMDKIQFCVVSMIQSYLPVNADDNVNILNEHDWIMTRSRPGYEWFEVSLAVLAQKNIPENNETYWTGVWKDAAHKFLPIQLYREGMRYNGWIELSFDKQKEKTILHKAAISKLPETNIQVKY